MSFNDVFIHPKALVDPGARIGPGTRVWAFTHVMKQAVIGSNCNVCDFSFVESGVTIGDDVTIKNGVQLWEGVTIENKVFLGPLCTFTNDHMPRSHPKRPKEMWLEKTLLKEGSSIGANATIICGITIGRYAFVAAGAVVTKDVPDFGFMKGVPARLSGWVCRCGSRLDFAANQDTSCDQCGRGFRRADGAVQEVG